MDDAERASAAQMRALLESSPPPPHVFRAALTSVPPSARDAWVDHVLGLEQLPADGPLPAGCVPYLPCSVDALLRLVDHADVQASDVFVDVGAGVGRAAALVHLLTGAPAIGIEIQPALVEAARSLAARVKALRFAPIEADAAGGLPPGSIFFLYCPFGGDRLAKVLADLEQIARTRPIRVCCVDLPLPELPWLAPAGPVFGDLAIYRSV